MSRNPPSNYLEELLKALGGHGGLNPPIPKPTGLAALFATPPQPNALTLASLSSPPKSTLGGLFGLASPPTPTPPALGTTNPFFKPQSSALGFFGVAPKPAFTGNPFANLKSTPKIRRVFYSFHYADIFRVNHIRKAGQFRPVDKQRLPTPQDRSLWEEAKLKNTGALKGMIDKGLEGTSATCVLAGYETWNRPWVRYEIAKSVARGNGLLAVYINNCNCPRNGYSLKGPNPLDQMAIGYDAQMRPRIYEWFNGTWRIFLRLGAPLASWPKWLPIAPQGQVMQLSHGAKAYDWITDNGAHNLLHWTHDAAVAAGR